MFEIILEDIREILIHFIAFIASESVKISDRKDPLCVTVYKYVLFLKPDA